MTAFKKATAKKLMHSAKSASERAYMPYSNFPVGAAVLCKDGTIVEGVNVENASYPVGLCAERAAVSAAISRGRRDIVAIAVFSPNGDAAPCGFCRQFLSEFGGEIVVIFMWESQLQVRPIKELLPFAFSKRSLR